jgi:7-cyano-7-deazaguanine reductase
MSPKDETNPTPPVLSNFSEISRLRTYPARESLLSDAVCLRFEGIGSLCPITGQPDTATVSVSYIPDSLSLDEDSVWAYLCSFRNFPAFNEEIVNRILDDLVQVAKPKEMTITGNFAPRGGISLTAEATFPAESVSES